jgi:hypothetical protein
MPLDLVAIRQRAAEARALDEGATTGPWSFSPNGTGAVYMHARTVGSPRHRLGSTYRPFRKKQIGKMYDGHDGNFPHRPENGEANARLATRYRSLCPQMAADVDALVAENVALRAVVAAARTCSTRTTALDAALEALAVREAP